MFKRLLLTGASLRKKKLIFLNQLLVLSLYSSDLTSYLKKNSTDKVVEKDFDNTVLNWFDRNIPNTNSIEDSIKKTRKSLDISRLDARKKIRSIITDDKATPMLRLKVALLFAEELSKEEQRDLEEIIASKEFQLDFNDESFWNIIPKISNMVSEDFFKSLPQKIKSSNEFEVKVALEFFRFAPEEKTQLKKLSVNSFKSAIDLNNTTINYHVYSLLTKLSFDSALSRKLLLDIHSLSNKEFYLSDNMMEPYLMKEKGDSTFEATKNLLNMKSKVQYLAAFEESRAILLGEIFNPKNSIGYRNFLKWSIIEYAEFSGDRKKILNEFAAEYNLGFKKYLDKNKDSISPYEFTILSDSYVTLTREEISKYIIPGLSSEDYRVREKALESICNLLAKEPDHIASLSFPKDLLNIELVKSMLEVFNDYISESESLSFPKIGSFFNSPEPRDLFLEYFKQITESPDSTTSQKMGAYRALLGYNYENGIPEGFPPKKFWTSKILESKGTELLCALSSGLESKSISASDLAKVIIDENSHQDCLRHILEGMKFAEISLTIDEKDGFVDLTKSLNTLVKKTKISNIKEAANTALKVIYENNRKSHDLSFAELIKENLNTKMIAKDSCSLICDLAKNKNWFNPQGNVEFNPEWQVFSSTAAYSTLYFLFMYKASNLCSGLSTWLQDFFDSLKAPQKESVLNSKVVEHWEKFNDKPDVSKKLYYNSFDIYVLSFGAQFLKESLSNPNVKIDKELRSRLEKVQVSLSRHRDSLLEQPSFNTFLGRNPTGDSRLQTYAFSLGLNSLSLSEIQNPSEKQKNAFKLAQKIVDNLTNKLAVPYNPSLSEGELTSRASSARNVPFYLALLRSDPENKNIQNLLFDSLKNYREFLPDLIANFMRDGAHVGSDHLGAHYYYPTFPYVGSAISILEKSKNFPDEQKKELSLLKKTFLDTHKSLINKDGFFTPIGMSPKDTVIWKNSDSFSQSLGALGLMSFIDSCEGDEKKDNSQKNHSILPH